MARAAERAMNMVEVWPLERLRSHPENGLIFGEPTGTAQFPEILKSIRAHGIWEPLIVKADGTILSGHVRFACAEQLKLKTVPVRVHQAFESFLDEVKFVIRSNTDRRQLNKQEIALAFTRLKEIPREQGGAKAKMGRPGKSAARSGLSESRDEAAKMLGVGRNEAEACATVFTTPGVPDEVKSAVNRDELAPSTAAKEIRAEVKRQGGEIKSPTPLLTLVRPSDVGRSNKAKNDESPELKYLDMLGRLLNAYRELDRVLTRMPLRTRTNPDEYHEYRGLIRDIAVRTIGEIQATEGAEGLKKQLAFTVIQGGNQ
jgi:ParB-like chromosome segregation protein Spo0J